MLLRSGDGRFEFDAAGATVRVVDVVGTERPLLEGDGAMFDVALPLPGDLPHRVGPFVYQATSDRQGFLYPTLSSERGDFAVVCRLHLRAVPEGGFAARLTVENRTEYVIPQVVFPRLKGFRPEGKAEQETLRLGRAIRWPYVGMKSPDDAATFLDLHRRWYFIYGMQEWNMKWWRLGSQARGVAVYSRDLGSTLAGLYVEKAADADRLAVSWAHYPHIAAGATWESPEIVIYPHNGDWRFGAEPYKSHVSRALATVKPTKYLRESIGIRSLFFSTYLYDSEVNYRFADLPVIARDALEHGIAEINIWFAFEQYFDLPMKLNAKLGTAAELKEALAECRRMGVNVSAFVSCRSLKPSHAPAGWFEVDDRGNRRTQHFSYSLGFVPPFNPPYCNRDESAFACPAVEGYRKAFTDACRELHALGFSSVCYDQLFADRLCYGDHGHAPQALAGALYELVRDVHREGQKVDAEASLSGEFFSDVSQTFQHYNWDWVSGTEPLDHYEAFRFVFPRYRMGLLVDRSRRWLLEGFCRGLMINFLPDGAEGLIGRDRPFSELAKKLAAARKTYLRFFEGDYFGTEDVAGAPGVISGLYRAGGEWLMIVANVSDKPVGVEHHVREPAKKAVPRSTLRSFGFMFFIWREGAEDWVGV